MDKYIPCRRMTSFVYLRNLATSDIPISGFPGCILSPLIKFFRRILSNVTKFADDTNAFIIIDRSPSEYYFRYYKKKKKKKKKN